MKLALAILLVPALASAEPVLVGVNAPVTWSDSFGMSISAGLTPHQALRANVAHYGDIGASGLVAALNGGEDESSHSGKTTDVGVGWVFYPDALWDGLSIELGALYRDRDVAYDDQTSRVATRTGTIAARAQLGWSWLFYDHFSIAVAVGASVGHESGTRSVTDDARLMTTTSSVSGADVEFEGMLRLGVAFDL